MSQPQENAKMDYNAMCKQLSVVPSSEEGKVLKIAFDRLPGGSVTMSAEVPQGGGKAAFDADTHKMKLNGGCKDAYAIAHEILHAGDYMKDGLVKDLNDIWRKRHLLRKEKDRTDPEAISKMVTDGAKDPEPFHPFKMLAQGLTEINAHLAQVLEGKAGSVGKKWGEEHSVKHSKDSPQQDVFDSVEHYFAFMNKFDPSSPTVQNMKSVYQTTFKKVLASLGDDKALENFLKDHVALREQIRGLKS